MKKIQKEDFQNYLSILRRGLRHLFFHNGFLKAIAVLISVALWAGLISQDESLTRDKTFQNVNVSVAGTETVKSNGFIVVSNLDELLDDVSVTAAVPQKQYENADVSAFNVRLDLSRIKGTGEQEVRLQSTNSASFGRVTSINPSSVTVQVEDYIIRQRIPVTVKVQGDPPEGWSMTQSSVDPSLIAVSGPRSLVQNVFKATAYVNTEDIEWTEGTTFTLSEIKLYNRAGDEVNSTLLNTTSSSVSIDSVLIELNLLPCETFSTGELIQVTGKVADGYRIKNVQISPENITVSARSEVLEQMSGLSLDRTSINVDHLQESTVFQLKVQKPSDDATLSNDTVTITVEIEEAET